MRYRKIVETALALTAGIAVGIAVFASCTPEVEESDTYPVVDDQGLTDAEVTLVALEVTWSGMTHTEQRDACGAYEVVGDGGVSALLGEDGVPKEFDEEAVFRFFADKCGAR